MKVLTIVVALLVFMSSLPMLVEGQVNPKIQTSNKQRLRTLFEKLYPQPEAVVALQVSKKEIQECKSSRNGGSLTQTVSAVPAPLTECPWVYQCHPHMKLTPRWAVPVCGAECERNVNDGEGDSVNEPRENGAVRMMVCTCCVHEEFCVYSPEPCPQSCTPEEGGSILEPDECTYPDNQGCPPGFWRAGGGGCCQDWEPTPIIIDVDGGGFRLTNAANGVWFDFRGEGKPMKVSWIASGSTNAWLVLDRNGNGLIDDATEMFGNRTQQPSVTDPNGFLALREYDKPENGGNGDGKIDSRDQVFGSLRLWTDQNRNAISEPGELSTLPEKGISGLDLNYHESILADSHGNQFRYRAKIESNARKGYRARWTYDVILLMEGVPPKPLPKGPKVLLSKAAGAKK